MRARLPIAVAATIASACSAPPTSDPRMVSAWMRSLYGAIRVERLSPPVASRLMAYATSALYSGLAAADPGMPALAGVLNGAPRLPRAASARDMDGTLAAVWAEWIVLDSLLVEALPTTSAALGRLADSVAGARAQGASANVRARSEEMGRAIGLAIVAWSRTDGFDVTRGRSYSPPAGSGLWLNDAPANTFATQSASGASETVTLDNPANQLRAGSSSDRALILSRPKRAGVRTIPAVNISGMSEPYWGEVRPFALARWDECPVPPVPPYATDTSSVLWREAREVYDVSKRLTPEQRTIALYWADNAGESGTPVGHWISIASQLVSERQLSAPEAARVMVLTAVAQADAFIASWGYKYRDNLLRPRTYIRRLIDPTWEPLIPTPPFPEYPSGHSTQSAAAAAVLTALLGDIAFTDSTSISIGHDVRRFDSFRAASHEAGLSRIYGGIHFPVGNLGGRALGECIGDRVVARWRATRKP